MTALHVSSMQAGRDRAREFSQHEHNGEELIGLV